MPAGRTVVVRDQKPELDDEGPGYMDPQGWVLLGTYTFDGSGQVVLTRGTDNPDNWTIADAVKFVSATAEVIDDDPALDSWYTSQRSGHDRTRPVRGDRRRTYAAFDARYDVAGNSIPVAGVYTGSLANNGEQVKLMRAGDPEPTGRIRPVLPHRLRRLRRRAALAGGSPTAAVRR